MMNPACNYVHVALYKVGLRLAYMMNPACNYVHVALHKVDLYDEPSL